MNKKVTSIVLALVMAVHLNYEHLLYNTRHEEKTDNIIRII